MNVKGLEAKMLQKWSVEHFVGTMRTYLLSERDICEAVECAETDQQIV